MSATAGPASAWTGERAFTWPGTAAQTTVAVLDWAAAHPGSPAPRGSLSGAGELAGSAAAAMALRRLARSAAGCLGAGHPILGDPGPIGLGGIFLAAAIGGRAHSRQARQLAALIESRPLGQATSTGWADALARHAVAGPALAPGALDPVPAPRDFSSLSSPVPPEDEEPLTEAILRASPLSAVLVRPAHGQPESAVDAALGLLSRPRGGDVLATVVSAWQPDASVLHWRARLLLRVAASHPAFVADVYAAARLRDTGEWDRRLSWARRRLDATSASDPPDELAVTTMQYWLALDVRQVRDMLRASRVLSGYDDIMALVRRYRLAPASAS